MKVSNTFIYTTLAIATFAVFHLTEPRIKEEMTNTYRPHAELGYVNDVCVMLIQDHRGEEFTVNYKVYRQLFAKGGYNTVDSTYYEQPSNEAFGLPTKFQKIKAKDADSVRKDFETSYSDALLADTLYQPSNSVLQRAISVHRRRFGFIYNPSTAKPNETGIITNNY